jgi:hypothetical protein
MRISRRSAIVGAATLSLMPSARRAAMAEGQQGGPVPAYPNFPHIQLAKFETTGDIQAIGGSGNGWASMADMPMADSPYGPTALQYTHGAAYTTGVIVGKSLAKPVDVRNGSIRLRYKAIATGAHANIESNYTFALNLYSNVAAGARPHSGSINASISRFSLGRWQTLTLPMHLFRPVESGADLSAIRVASIASKRNGGTAITMALGSVDFVPNPRTKAAIIFGFDDGYAGPYTYAYPILAARGKGGVLFPGRAKVDIGGGPDKITLAQVRELAGHGWQIACQAYDSEGRQPDAAAYLAQFNATRAFNATHGMPASAADGADGSWFSNVNAATALAQGPFKATFRTGRSFYSLDAVPGFPMAGGGETFPFGDRQSWKAWNAGSFSKGSATDIPIFQGCLHQVAASKGVYCHVTHGGMNGAGEYRQTFDYIIGQIDAHPELYEIHTVRSLLDPYLALYGAAPADYTG